MQYVIFDDPVIRPSLLPLTYTRPVSGVRVGILTLHEKWERHLGEACGHLTQPYLQKLYPFTLAAEALACFLNGAVCAHPSLLQALGSLAPHEALVQEGVVLAAHGTRAQVEALLRGDRQGWTVRTHVPPVTVIRKVWHIFQRNGDEIAADFALLTAGRRSAPIADPHTIVYHPDQVFLEPGVQIKAAILNAEPGPIYLGRDAQIHEGAIIRGPFAMGEGAAVSFAAKIRGGTTVGPYCKAGGEINNSVLFANSNKSHDGFIGNTVLGEWCNLGADTNTSNLKNNYGNVKVWSYPDERFEDAGLQFCGLIMGDHSKAGINTMFNTGTVVGIGANIFGAGYPGKFVPSFSWANPEGPGTGFSLYRLDKFLDMVEHVMGRRHQPLDDPTRAMLKNVYSQTTRYRQYFD
ncbi:UDP-N-acetylglucosamine diphosphorylase/glucosamine-1-phosphate N-acetyltransferase [Catalinimonas alkaloidigena]|uniref:UDP-N-acetylglucosamine diphosphorylase/glucosamine-1-phosphate N-acetyltransferase n=1 Tax=Catalinimonas alkaloidigena TaxID=1075417 RepID=A0A1G9UPD6_9BACT|nr:GlmU family protein [Catalinimonas alkaloidigena]SDM61771.1 UDP-N-acetylglucosamine diphosphorylase/glucosamine-1-phosphate N-acetyltransferase [Catalinimonas alkaloidigena]